MNLELEQLDVKIAFLHGNLELELQKCVSLSTTETEYIAAIEARKEMLWMKQFL